MLPKAVTSSVSVVLTGDFGFLRYLGELPTTRSKNVSAGVLR